MNNMTHKESHKIFCFGLGYTAKHLKTFFPSLRGTSRLGGQETIGFDKSNDVEKALKMATHVLVSIPPGDQGDLVLKHYQQLLKASNSLKWVGYLSSTSVYGDHQGRWVDETTPCLPTSKRSQKRLEAENAWLASGLPIHIFRLSGIYGEGRSVFSRLESDALGQRIQKPGHKFSRIHVTDICQILMDSMNKPSPGEIFNMADDLPAESREVIEYACDLIGRPYPPLVPFAQAILSEREKAFYEDNKCVSTQKLKSFFDTPLTYPTYKEGLLDIYRHLTHKL
jgi:nucleoside-diphosphate-sugar epimerase